MSATPQPPAPLTRHPVALTANAHTVLRRRYLLRDDGDAVTETPEAMLARVATHVATAEAADEQAPWAQRFYDLMASLRFLPNSPTLMNAGTGRGTLAACFVLPVDDTLESIMATATAAAMVQKFGGGTGFDFSPLRGEGEPIASTHGAACGPISALLHYDDVSRLVTQGGKRDGANMAILRADHPDITDFIHLKDDQRRATRFNVSVAVTDEWMAAAQRGDTTALRDPRDGEPRGTVSPALLLQEIADAAWRGGDPGLIFLDRINRDNPTPRLGALAATNPCGEVPLLPYEACTLGSMNLARFWDPTIGTSGDLDWEALASGVTLAVRFLDNVVEVGEFPLPEIRAAVRGNRKIGLGVMGFADLLIAADLAYDSEAALDFADRLAGFIATTADQASAQLGAERGAFPNWERSIYRDGSGHPQAGTRYRNATRICIAPTGTISLLAGASSGIEPLFSLAHHRRMGDGTMLREVNPAFRGAARAGGFDSDGLDEHLAAGGSLADRPEVPDDVRRRFGTALGIGWEWHVRMQATFQRHTDLAVSKTVNLPHTATPADVLAVYRTAHDLGCKGITVYRDRSRAVQVLSHAVPPVGGAASTEHGAAAGEAAGAAAGETAGETAGEAAGGGDPADCPDCGQRRDHLEGCLICPACGDSRCG